MNEISIQQSEAFWQIKAFAIFTVFFAHMPGHEVGDSKLMVDVFDAIGMFGVPLFMMLSGYFNYTSKFSWVKTLKNLCIPLLIWGTICYILHIIKTPTDTPFIDWLKFVGGSKSIFYFVPMLFCCIVVSHYFNTWVLLVLGCFAQILTTYTNVIPYNDVWTQNLNPLIFVVPFSVGRLFREYDVLNKYRTWWSYAALGIIILFLLIKGKPDYYSPFTVIFTSALLIILYGVFMSLSIKWLSDIGKISFVIYLCHIQIAGFVQAAFRPLWGGDLEPLKVVIAFAIVLAFCYCIKLICEKVLKSQIILKYLGYR